MNCSLQDSHCFSPPFVLYELGLKKTRPKQLKQMLNCKKCLLTLQICQFRYDFRPCFPKNFVKLVKSWRRLKKCMLYASFLTQNIKYFKKYVQCRFLFINYIFLKNLWFFVCYFCLEQWAPVLHLQLVIIAKQPLMAWLARREVNKVRPFGVGSPLCSMIF